MVISRIKDIRNGVRMIDKRNDPENPIAVRVPAIPTITDMMMYIIKVIAKRLILRRLLPHQTLSSDVLLNRPR
jgi:hypothetical protein